jgi:hypothetical protein
VLPQVASVQEVWQQMLLAPLLIQTPLLHSLTNVQVAPSAFLAMQAPPEQYFPVPQGTGVPGRHPPEPLHVEAITDVPSTLQVAVPHVSPACV